MSFGELCVLVIVTIVVVGPKDLPRYLRKAGQLAGRLRRMASDVRAQSGIDEVLRTEGLTKEIAEIRHLARGNFIEPVTRGLRSSPGPVEALPPAPAFDEFVVLREREYPTEGADSFAAVPDTATMYAKGLPVSKLARDPLYVAGDADAPLPPPVPEADELPYPASLSDKRPDESGESAAPREGGPV
jgi:sec-independent protein translocase protein TatB